MCDSISHRGPDAEGIFVDSKIGLGHRRLSILDLSSNANQPYFSKCGNFIAVYNGEVYNYQEIAKQLNIPLSTHSDTEVIIESYLKWGEAILPKFIGMFAFAIYNRNTNEIILVRDRMGIKPLYYFCDKQTFIFASDIKSILAIPSIKNRLSIDQSAISDFLYLGFIPSPKTIYNEIHVFPKGNVAKFNRNKFLGKLSTD